MSCMRFRSNPVSSFARAIAPLDTSAWLDVSHSAMWGTAMDVGEWLKGLGLGQYEAAFRDHEIEADVLADLTDSDFEKIGLPLGARKRLRKAIANLAQAAPPPSTPAPSQAKPPPFGPIRPNAARSRSCSAIWSVRPLSQPSSTRRTGAPWSTPTSTRRPRL